MKAGAQADHESGGRFQALAHELGNVFMTISGSAEMILLDPHDLYKVVRNANRIIESARKGSQLVQASVSSTGSRSAPRNDGS